MPAARTDLTAEYRAGLGPDGDLLQLSEEAVAASANNQSQSPFAALRLRTDAAKRFKKVENAQAVIWKMLLVAEPFRRLKAPELMKDVYQGAEYVNGVPVPKFRRRKPPELFLHTY